jgi:hypothetical protein
MNNMTASLQKWDVLGERRGKVPNSEKDFIVYHRIVGVLRAADRTSQLFALLELTKTTTPPDIVSAEELESRLREGTWLASEFDPFVPLVRSPDEIREKLRGPSLKAMRARLQFVQIVDNAGWDAFRPDTRAQLIAKASRFNVANPGVLSEAPTRSEAWIRKLLRRYWLYGGSGFALLPATLFNGSISREERLRRAAEGNERPRFTRKAGPKPRGLERPDLGPEIEPDYYERMRVHLQEILDDKNIRASLARKFDLRRAIPWQQLTRELNKKLLPKTISWDGAGGSIRNAAGVRLLTRRQVKAFGESVINAGDFVLKVKDWKQVALDHHVPRGDVRNVATRSGERYEVDVMEADAFFMHDGTLLPIGRIYVAFVVDCFSRMIAAAYPWAGDPDVRMVTYALAAAAMPKSEWGRIIGVTFTDVEWPCQGLPESIVCDNGEAATHGGDRLAELVFDVVPNPPYLAYLKQAVETSFRLANVGHIDMLPASTKGPRERCSENKQKEAKISVAQFTREINIWACRVGNYRLLERYPEHEEFIREKTALRPIDLWQHGCRVRGGALRPYVRERHLPSLLESREVRIVQQGLDLDGVFYDFADDNRPDWFTRLKRAATAGPAKVTRVHYDRLTLNRVYLVPKDPASPVVEVPLSPLSREWKDYSRREFDVVKEFRGNQSAPLRHEHNIRTALFGQVIADDVAQSEQAITGRFGSIKKRADVAQALGKEGPIADQMAADAARDQKMHPAASMSSTSAKHQNLPATPAASYDEILGLN